MNMYKLLNYLFDWDYILWNNIADSGIARVFKLPSGKVVYWRYWSTSILDVISNPDKVEWLTCHPSKWFPELLENKPDNNNEANSEASVNPPR